MILNLQNLQVKTSPKDFRVFVYKLHLGQSTFVSTKTIDLNVFMRF